MITRLSRKKADPSIYAMKGQGGLLDAFDDSFKFSFRVTDDEFDCIAETLSPKDLDLFTHGPNDPLTFAEKRRVLEILRELYNKPPYIVEFNGSIDLSKLDK